MLPEIVRKLARDNMAMLSVNNSAGVYKASARRRLLVFFNPSQTRLSVFDATVLVWLVEVDLRR